MDMQMLKAIIEALRQSPMEPGIYRDPGQVPRQVRGGVSDLLRNTNRSVNYGKYQKIQDSIGDTAVDYDEYMKGQ